MGLYPPGPPVCVQCRMLAVFGKGVWTCIFCGEVVYNHLWEFDQQDRNEIENNSEWIIQIMDSLKDIKQQP